MERDWNPEILQIATNHLTRGINTNFVFNVGDEIPGVFTGVLGYERNIFGDGAFSFILTDSEGFEPIYSFFQGKCNQRKRRDLFRRAKADLPGGERLSAEQMAEIEESVCAPLREFEKGRVSKKIEVDKPYFESLLKTTSLVDRQPLDMNLRSTEEHLTVGTFNVENLAGNEPRRITMLAKSIVTQSAVSRHREFG